MAYRIAKSPEGEWRFWEPRDVIPEGHTEVRYATAEEAALIDEIEAGNASFDEDRMEIASATLYKKLNA